MLATDGDRRRRAHGRAGQGTPDRRRGDRPGRCLSARVLGAAALVLLLGASACERDLADDLVARLETRHAEELQRLTRRLLKLDQDDLVPALRQGLRAPPWRRRYMSAKLLGQVRAQAALDDLVSALGDTSAAVIAAAAEALGQLRDRRATAPLVARLDHPADVVAIRAAEALGRIGDPGALPALCRRSRTGLLRVRAASLAALGPSSDPEAAAAWSDSARACIEAGLRDPAPSLRSAAIQALRGLSYRGAAAALLAMLGDPDPTVRHVVVQALGQITGPRHPAWEDQVPDMARLVAALDSTARAADNLAVRQDALQALQAIDAARRRRAALATP